MPPGRTPTVRPPGDAILKLTRQALIEHGHQRYEMPAKIGVQPYDNVIYHAMPAYLPGPGIVGMKWIECYPGNPCRFNLPQTIGLLVVNDVEGGVPLAIMDSAWLTVMRTSAVSVLAAAALHPGATAFGMFGCGVQGKELVRYAALAMPGLKTVYVHDTNGAAADALIAELQSELDLRLVKGESAEEVTKSAEVLSSATVILREPLAVVKGEAGCGTRHLSATIEDGLGAHAGGDLGVPRRSRTIAASSNTAVTPGHPPRRQRMPLSLTSRRGCRQPCQVRCFSLGARRDDPIRTRSSS
ncbi:hypothetical protein [Streptomyces sioyaensis]|uniref:hypothetical protein n=1 Tax=Streptomyces sioyaensis TaxID=67364 RepID=UPI003794F041